MRSKAELLEAFWGAYFFFDFLLFFFFLLLEGAGVGLGVLCVLVTCAVGLPVLGVTV